MYNRSQELGYITRKLKLLAQQISTPIIVISQLNRNIENRSDKEPLLSDLKESGCISIKNSIKIYSKNNNKTNIKNFSYNSKIVSCQIRNIKKDNTYFGRKEEINTVCKLINLTSKVNISQKYLFQYLINHITCVISHNHKYSEQSKWISSSRILRLTTIDHTNKKNSQQAIEKKYINYIFSNRYDTSYDINQNSYFNLICNDTILHNSIEQDADIVMIIYKRHDIEVVTDSKNSTIIDLKISKNRNGRTGACKIQFIPETSQFKNISKIR